jgi:hypothetical protein
MKQRSSKARKPPALFENALRKILAGPTQHCVIVPLACADSRNNLCIAKISLNRPDRLATIAEYAAMSINTAPKTEKAILQAVLASLRGVVENLNRVIATRDKDDATVRRCE